MFIRLHIKILNFTLGLYSRNEVMHIGHKIKQRVYEQRISVNEFAQKINKSRTVVYHIFGRETIDTGLLEKISEVLDHNFFRYYFAAINDKKAGVLASEPEVLYTAKEKLENDSKFFMLEKEVNYLREINSLLKAQIESKK